MSDSDKTRAPFVTPPFREPLEGAPFDFDRHIAELRAALVDARIPALVRQVEALSVRAGKGSRIPFGLRSEWIPAGETKALKTIRPYLPVRLTHLVLSEQTSKAFVLQSLMAGNCMLQGDGDPLPLDTFSVSSYANNPQLLAVNSFEGTYMLVNVGSVIRLMVTNTAEHSHQFSGVLWGIATEC